MGDETVDVIEAKYISGLSAVMVATIQEAKDRISQIEYIFCSQLFPNFQSKSKAFEKVYSDARLAACDAWKEREKDLLSQIEELKVENLGLVKEKEKLSEENDKLVSMPLRLKSLEDYIAYLKRKWKSRSEEVGNSVELHSGLVQVLQVKGSDVLGQDEVKMLLSEVKSLKEELSKKALLTENLLKKVEHLSTEASESERKLSSCEEQKERLTTRLQVFEENVGRLEEMLRQKSDELEVLQGKLNLTEKEMLECRQKIVEKANATGEELGGMNMKVKDRSYLAELETLRCQNEEKSVELAMEVKKKNEAISAFKKLKSQYNYLRKRFGLTTDSDLQQQSQLESESNQMGQHERPAISKCKSPERKQPEADKVRTGTGSRINHEKESVTNTLLRTPTTSISPITRSPGIRSDPSGAKSLQLSGSKRPASIWRDTRSRQSPGGKDPHDDFLDTPIENIKRVSTEEKHVPVAAAEKDADSDDETQDMNPKPSPSRQRIQVAETSRKSFKHVESVRKKAERENLKGIECKQCKKFYDAVHPENEGNGKSLRCEHHEGVSRHRYKYAPPMTPEGFWNIGFESEM
ncbi:protein gamma response 1-like isoform X1 [Brassica napus]|nr:protein gamma response 1-like isoform X1 [Brassica napus]